MATKKKPKKIKVDYRSEEQNEVLKFVKILGVLIILVLVVYFFTRVFVSKDLFNKKEEDAPIAGEVNYSLVPLIGNMLNKSDEEYYVFIYSSEDLIASYYRSIANLYSRNEKPLPIYTADLENELNKKYIAEDKSNLNVTKETINNFRVKDVALLKIKNGRITKTLEKEEEIAKELKYVKDTTK